MRSKTLIVLKEGLVVLNSTLVAKPLIVLNLPLVVEALIVLDVLNPTLVVKTILIQLVEFSPLIWLSLCH
jgi:hypothetical protein